MRTKRKINETSKVNFSFSFLSKREVRFSRVSDYFRFVPIKSNLICIKAFRDKTLMSSIFGLALSYRIQICLDDDWDRSCEGKDKKGFDNKFTVTFF